MHNIARSIVALAIVLLAIVAAPRLALDYTPRGAAPEIIASIRFPLAAGGDPVDVTTRYVVPLETAVRALGDVMATRGDAGADSVSMTIRFRRGVDAELKAARLTSELASLRAKLPEQSSISVFPSSDRGSQPSVIVALTTRDAGRTVERIADELRVTPGVREVTTFGATEDEIDVRTFGDAPSGLAGSIRRALAPRMIGRNVLSAPSTTRLRDVRIGGQRLESMATIREHHAEPPMIARLDGRDAVVLWIGRDDNVSLFAFDSAVHHTLRGRGTIDVWNEAAELRRLLLYLAAGALAASIILTFAGGPMLSAYVLLAFAVMTNVCRIAGLRLDALSLLAVAIAIAAVAPMAVLRSRGALLVAALFATLPLVATSLASSALTAILTMPARLFALASLAALAAAAMLPPAPPRGETKGRLERRLLRASAAIVLAAVATAIFLLAWFGDRLDPRHTVRTPERGHVYVRLGVPAGTPLAPTIKALARVERALKNVDGIPRFWSYAQPGRATIVADVAPQFQRTDLFELLKLRIAAAVPLAAGSVTVDNAFDRTATQGGDDLEERPIADEEGRRYRVLLKGTDANVIRRALESMTIRLAQQGLARGAINAAWPEASTQITLVPRSGVAPDATAKYAQSLAARTLPPHGRLLPDGRMIAVAGVASPHGYDDVPRAADVFSEVGGLGRPPSAVFDIRHDPVSGRVTRELGRFVLPVEITPQGLALEQKKSNRANADRALSLMALPAGVVLERPSLAKWDLSVEKLRLIGLAALLPSMLFALAAIELSSLRRALVALAPGVIAIACASPALLLAGAPMDEVVLLAIGAAVCCVTGVATVGMLSFDGVGATYRELRQFLLPCAIASGAGALMLAIAAGGGGELGETWRAPLVAACVVAGAGGVCSLMLPAAIERLTGRRLEVAATAGWKPAVREGLEVQNVTKIYAGGFRALHRVSFALEPGVIGLLGPNGAGKTTLLRIITGLLLPTRGVVRFGGVEVRPRTLAEYRRHIGFLPQEFNAYAGLTAAQFLDYWALERGMAGTRERNAEVERLLAVARLEAHAGRKLRDFSGGMRQRIGIARAMIGDPPLLVVDEPTTGLDIEARAHFRELITTLSRDRIIILSTHIAGDVESTAARLLLLAAGRLVWDGTPDALIARARGRVFETIVDEEEARVLNRLHRITTRVRIAEGVRLRGIVGEGESLPGAAAGATLEEAYLAEIAPRERIGGASFAFVYESSR